MESYENTVEISVLLQLPAQFTWSFKIVFDMLNMNMEVLLLFVRNKYFSR